MTPVLRARAHVSADPARCRRGGATAARGGRRGGTALRLIGGVAVRLHVQGELHPAFVREIRDIDLVTGKGDGQAAGAFLEAQGYVANRTFNAMHGARRMLFYDEPTAGSSTSSSTRSRCATCCPSASTSIAIPFTVPLADLLLTKLQIVTLNAKDRSDAYAVLLEHELGAGDVEHIDARASPSSARATGASTARCRSTSSGSAPCRRAGRAALLVLGALLSAVPLLRTHYLAAIRKRQ